MRGGKAVRGRSISLKYLIDTRTDYQVAVIVSKKVSKKAVVRNLLRRRTYAAIREHSALIPDGFKGVFSVFDESLQDLPYTDFSALIKDLLDKVAR